MSEENTKNLTPDTDGAQPANGESTDENLTQELEQLRDTFQATYDKTAAEAAEKGEDTTQDGPVIQAIDYSDEKAYDELNDDDEEDKSEEEEFAKRARPKKKKKSGKAGLTVCVIVMILSLLSTAFLAGALTSVIKVPDSADYMSNMIKASSAKTAAERIKYHKAALEFCTEQNGLESNRQKLIESIVVDTCETEGFGAAKTYFDENGTEDMKKSPKTAEFKEFVEVSDKIGSIADKAFDAVQSYADKEEEPDFKKIAKEIGANDLIVNDIAEALESIYNGAVAAKAASSEEQIQSVSKSYLTAYQTLNSMGASCQSLLERTALMLYNNGYAYEANIIIENYMTEDMLASPVTAEFSTMQNDIKSASSFKGDIYQLASEQFAAGKTSKDDFTSLVTGDGLSEKIKESIVSMIADAVEAMEAEKDANLTKASSLYSLALDSEKALGISTLGTAWKTTEILLKTGNIQGANEIATKYISETELKAADSENTALYNTVTQLYNAQKNANEIFYTAYSNYYYSGTAIDKASVNKDLDALLTSSSNNYDKAMVDYYKYLTEAFTDKDTATMKKYLEEYASLLKDFPLVYSYDLIGQYISEKDYAAAFELTDKVLAVNKADDFAGKYASLRDRMNDGVEKGLATAEKSMELSGETNYAAYEAALCYLILGNYEKAIELTSPLVKAGLSYDLCDLVKVLEALYTEKSGTAAETLKTLVTQVDSAMSQSSVTVSDNAKAIIDGTKKPADVLMSGTYNFS